MKVEYKTLILIFTQQILLSNGQLVGTPPFLQWLSQGLYNGNQQQQSPLNPLNFLQLFRPATSSPNTPINPLNFLQLFRPAPSAPILPVAPAAPLTPVAPVTPQSPLNGIIPILMQQFLQNLRPPVGQQQQQQQTQQPTSGEGGFSSDATANVGSSSNPQNPLATIPNLSNLLALQQLQQLLQANNPLLYGLQSNGLSQITPTSATTGLIPNQFNNAVQQNTQTPAVSGNNLNSAPTTRPTAENIRPVTELSNEIGVSTEAPFISLAPVRPNQPNNLNTNSYVPYTSTIKPLTNNFNSNAGSDLSTNYMNIKVTTEPSDIFIPIYYEKEGSSSNALDSTRKLPLTTKVQTAVPIKHSPLYNKFITSTSPVNSAKVTEHVITSPRVELAKKEKPQTNTEAPLTSAEASLDTSEKQTDSNLNSVGSEQTTGNFQSDQLPGDLIQGDELPNDFIAPADPTNENDILNYQILTGQLPQDFFPTNPNYNYQESQGLQNIDPYILLNQLQQMQQQAQQQGNNYNNIPHFAYQNQYPPWFYPCQQPNINYRGPPMRYGFDPSFPQPAEFYNLPQEPGYYNRNGIY